MFKDFCQ
jgi:hypothetical protein